MGARSDRYRVTDVAVGQPSDSQLDGKIVLTGQTFGREYAPAIAPDIILRDWTLLRFNGVGALDAMFADNGVAAQRVYPPGPDQIGFGNGSAAQTSQAQGVLLEPDGRIVVSGFRAEGTTVTQYNADGS